MSATDGYQLVLQQGKHLVLRPVLIILMDVCIDERVGRHKLRFKVWQRLDAKVLFRLVQLYVCLLADKCDKETQTADEHGDRLNIHPIDARLDDVEFARIVRRVQAVVKRLFYL